MKKRIRALLAAAVVAAVASTSIAADLKEIAALLTKKVGGAWTVETVGESTLALPSAPIPRLDKGTYAVFATGPNGTASAQAEVWMQHCQSPLVLLGSNEDVAVVTYVAPHHPVSRAILKALDLAPAPPRPPAESAK